MGDAGVGTQAAGEIIHRRRDDARSSLYPSHGKELVEPERHPPTDLEMASVAEGEGERSGYSVAQPKAGWLLCSLESYTRNG